jgi:hypothetical protein
MVFNGLPSEEWIALNDIMVDIGLLVQRVEGLGRHRSYSLAVTKLEEAKHWMRDRASKPA